jgi:hypothetical protein
LPSPTDDSDRSSAGADPAQEDPTWPPHVPHIEIDALIDRLDRGMTLEPAEAYLLIRQVAKEAQRLRTLVVRLSTAKLAEADREARSIVAEALGHADAMRSVGLSVLNTRLDEADRVLATLRASFQVELRAAELAQVANERGPAPRPGPGAQGGGHR